MKTRSWIRHCLGLVPTATVVQRSRTMNYTSSQLRLEALEKREVPANYTASDARTLLIAINSANADNTADTIALQAGTYNLDAQLHITNSTSLLIQGNGQILNAATAGNRAFLIDSGGAAAPFHNSVTFQNLTISGGIARDDGTGNANTSALGGGILDYGGDLTLDHVTIQNNQALGAADKDASGGGIAVSGYANLNIINGSAIQNNQAVSGNGGGGNQAGTASGGGIEYMITSPDSSNKTFNISNSTISGNQARGGNGGNATASFFSNFGGFAQGGGISVESNVGRVSVSQLGSFHFTSTASSISGNAATGGQGGQGIAGTDATSINQAGGAAGDSAHGGGAFGGGLYFTPFTSGFQTTNRDAIFSGTTISGNAVTGGAGVAGLPGGNGLGTGAGGKGGAGGNGGFAQGGGAFLEGTAAGTSTVQFLASSVIAGNAATAGASGASGKGGNGGTGGNGGDGGSTANPNVVGGGGIFADGIISFTFDASTISSNSAQGGRDGDGGAGGSAGASGLVGGAGGDAGSNLVAVGGGGLEYQNYNSTDGTLRITNSTIESNSATAGASSKGGAGGSGNIGGKGGSGTDGRDTFGGGISFGGGTRQFSTTSSLQVTITGSTITTNFSGAGSGSSGGAGGIGIATGGAGGIGGRGGIGTGGAISITQGSIIFPVNSTVIYSVANSTIAANSADGGAGGNGGAGGSSLNGKGGNGGNSGSAIGGGISADGSAVLNLIDTTIAANGTSKAIAGTAGAAGAAPVPGTAGAAGVGGLDSGGGLAITPNGATPVVKISNSLFAFNGATTGDNISGAITTSKNNLVEVADGSTGLSTANGDLFGTRAAFLDSKLSTTLANNGGPTKTIALLTGSPAIDAGSNADASGTTDQRGLTRIVNGRVDIGAFEVQSMTGTTTSTSTSLTAMPNPVVSGSSVTFTATVAATTMGAVPTGTVTFLDGTTTLGTGILANGVATFSTSTLSTATHSITANYGGATSGNNTVSPSTSSAVSLVVSAIGSTTSTTTTLTAQPNPVTSGNSVTLTATVLSATIGSATPTGTVTFLDGTSTLGTGTLSNGVAFFSTSGLSTATHSITARYEGAVSSGITFTSSTSSAVSLVVQAGSTGSLTADERFIRALYIDLLGRPGDVSELDYHVGILRSARGSVDIVTYGIQHSPEAEDRMVKGWYQTYLGRSAAGGEEQSAVDRLIARQTEETVLAAILGGPEFYSRAQSLVSSGTPQQRYAQSLYQILLNRTGSDFEITMVANQLASSSPTEIVRGFLISTEYRNNTIASYFTTLLHRTADSPSLNDAVKSNVNLADVRHGVFVSAEFYTNG